MASGDFNGDGKLDLVVLDDGGFSVSLGNGDGTFQKPTFYPTQLSYSLAVADFNNDGNLDIVVANENLSPSTVSVYLGNGDGTFRSPIDSNTTNYNEFVAVGDFNGDGKMDIVVVENPYISVLWGNGDGTFQAPSDNDSFVGAQNVAVGDFNNDHKVDVVVVGFFGGSQNIGVLLGNGDPRCRTRLPPLSPGRLSRLPPVTSTEMEIWTRLYRMTEMVSQFFWARATEVFIQRLHTVLPGARGDPS